MPVNTEKSTQSKTADSEVLDLRNLLIDYHIEKNQQDQSYRPIQVGERW